MGRIVQRWAMTVGQLLLDLFVGARCAGCGAAGRTPCDRCVASLQAAAAAPDAAWVEAPTARALVLAAKLGTWRGGAGWFARRLVERCALADVDAVTWVPADRSRRARRGGCLPERCARRVARQLGVPAVQLLRRTGGASQRGLGRVERRRNVADAYRPSQRRVAALPEGSRVLLVDDVRTTGATLDVVGGQLEAAGLRVRRVALLAVGTPWRSAGDPRSPVSTPSMRVGEMPQRARNSRSRSGPSLPIRWHDVRRKGSTRT